MHFDVINHALEGGFKSLEDVQKTVSVETFQLVSSSISGRDLEAMAKALESLKEWTGKTNATIIYDSTVDEFTDQGLFDKVKSKRNIALIGFTTDGDVFGGFYSVAVEMQEMQFFDPNMFVFSFESHGRCETPQMFIVKEELRENVYV